MLKELVLHCAGPFGDKELVKKFGDMAAGLPGQRSKLYKSVKADFNQEIGEVTIKQDFTLEVKFLDPNYVNILGKLPVKKALGTFRVDMVGSSVRREGDISQFVVRYFYIVLKKDKLTAVLEESLADSPVVTPAADVVSLVELLAACSEKFFPASRKINRGFGLKMLAEVESRIRGSLSGVSDSVVTAFLVKAVEFKKDKA